MDCLNAVRNLLYIKSARTHRGVNGQSAMRHSEAGVRCSAIGSVIAHLAVKSMPIVPTVVADQMKNVRPVRPVFSSIPH